MSTLFPAPAPRRKPYIASFEQYQSIYKKSLENPEAYWSQRATELLDWFSPWQEVCRTDLARPAIEWFCGGTLNAAYNCLDRHIEQGRGDELALIWQGEAEEAVKKFTYAQLTEEVKKCASVMRSLGIKKGDRVATYLPMIPEAIISVLACARIGAVHCVVFAGFSPAALADRVNNSQAKLLITADAVNRAGKVIPLKENLKDISTPSLEKCLVVQCSQTTTPMTEGTDLWWHEHVDTAKPEADCVPMDAEDILFILYTSGSTGTPKGIVHTTGGYLLYAAHTCQAVFDLQAGDMHWCTADLGWITGHTYITYGPLALGATSIVFEGVPTWPDAGRYWQIVEKFRPRVFYTAPTVVRSLMKAGEQFVQGRDLSSLEILGSVGEPINPEAWLWYHKHVGGEKIPVVDTWWQTETGGHLIAPLPFATPTKPGSATFPLPGIDIDILQKDGTASPANTSGHLVVKKPWPGMLRGVYGSQERFKVQYFTAFEGMYEAGDGALRDDDGYCWITGRLDDVINVSGHRMTTAEIESALVSHEDVAEAAVVGVAHDVKGQTIYAFVTLIDDAEPSDDLTKELRLHVRKELGAISTPEFIQYAYNLPKTRSGKIMRRILRKVGEGENDIEQFGDISTLADSAVVVDLIEERKDLFEE